MDYVKVLVGRYVDTTGSRLETSFKSISFKDLISFNSL